ncbi:MAG: hypothetical protein JO033_02210, partial [Acidobacteriaceae bacterium]|nr:hypothetical protein [Acidobacteriaceae bacterium]
SSGASLTLTAYTSATCCAVTPNSPITPSNPAGAGELISVNASGLGILATAEQQTYELPGYPYAGPQPNTAQNTVSATMGGSTAQVIAAGFPPGSYSVYQVQMIVPTSLSANNATQLTIAQNAFVSNLVTVAVGTPVLNGSGQSGTGTGQSQATSSVFMNIGKPTANSPALSGIAAVGGWALDASAGITSIAIAVDGTSAGTAMYGSPRSDVCAVAGSSPDCPNVGWNGSFDTTQFADGTHQLQITATAADGARATHSQTFTSSNYGNLSNFPTKVGIDQPASGASLQGKTNLSGWAINTSSAIADVILSIDGHLIGTATYGASRSDICAAFGNPPGCPGVGWSYLLDTTTLATGTHTLAVRADATNAQFLIQSVSFTVTNWATQNNPVHTSIDAPNANSAALSGMAAFGGWALADNSIVQSVGVDIDGIPYGNAGYGGNRPDVCAVYPGRAGCPNVGWNFLIDTTELFDGTHTVAITANSAGSQGYTTTQQFQVANMGTANNSTRVSIGIPNPHNSALTGMAAIGGWAINDSTPITSIQVSVDSLLKGNAAYGGSRPDVCTVYPNRPSCPNVGWNYMLDTTQLANGVHTLEVTATSEAGQRATAGATFTVSNAVNSGPIIVSIAQPNSTSAPYAGLAQFSGSALNQNGTAITGVTISVNGVPYGPAAVVNNAQSGQPNSVAWSYTLDTTQLPAGAYTLGVTATAADGTQAIGSATFQIANWVTTGNPFHVNIDTPNSGSSAFSGFAHFGGWAVNDNGPISGIFIAVDGIPFGAAGYGGARPDVCAAYPGRAGCPDVGWNAEVDTTLLSNGTHTLAVTASTLYNQNSTTSTTFTVHN